MAGISFMPVADYGEPNWWLTCILVDPGAFGADREQIRLALEAVDIESRPTWKPLHLQPVYAGAPIVGGAVCASVFERGLCLPTGSALSPAEVQRVVDIISSLCQSLAQQGLCNGGDSVANMPINVACPVSCQVCKAPAVTTTTTTRTFTQR